MTLRCHKLWVPPGATVTPLQWWLQPSEQTHCQEIPHWCCSGSLTTTPWSNRALLGDPAPPNLPLDLSTSLASSQWGWHWELPQTRQLLELMFPHCPLGGVGTVPKPRDAHRGLGTSAEGLSELLWAKKTELKPTETAVRGTSSEWEPRAWQEGLLQPRAGCSCPRKSPPWAGRCSRLFLSLSAKGQAAELGRAGLSSPRRPQKPREQQEGERKWQNLFKTGLEQGAINQAQK